MGTDPQPRAIVCGAGIAGLAAALVLGRGGWAVLVLERSARLRDDGYMVDFFGPGYATAERWGLLPALRRVAYRFDHIRWCDRDGRTAVATGYDRFVRILGGRLMSLMRGDLERALHDALPSSVEIRFGHTIGAIEESAHGIEAEVGGVAERAEVILGADGIHSRVRELAFGPESEFVHDLGYRTAAFIFHDERIHRLLGSDFHIVSAPDRQAGLYPLRGGRVATFFAHRGSDSLGEPPVEVLRRAYAGLGWLIPEALAAASTAPSIYYDSVAQVRMPRWHRGRVALVGDAGQAVSLLAGQGASIAMAAGEAVGRALCGGGPRADALARYEAALRPPVEKRQASGRRIAKWFVPASGARLAIRNAGLRMMQWPGFEWTARRFFAAEETPG